MHQHQAHAQAAEQGDVIDQVVKAFVLDGFATELLQPLTYHADGQILDEPEKYVNIFTAIDGDEMKVAWQVIGYLDMALPTRVGAL